jgi:hypothetical protein
MMSITVAAAATTGALRRSREGVVRVDVMAVRAS